MDCIAIDLSKAFDRVDHERLMDKVKGIGLDMRVTGWIGEFLMDRTQQVKIGEALSTPVKIERGVPQGSILGPLLFLIYINDLGVGLLSRTKLFADDIIIYREVKVQGDCDILQNDVNKIQKWAQVNGMVINGDKSQVIRFSNKRCPVTSKYILGGKSVPLDNECRYLGVKMQNTLHWGSHISTIVSKAYRTLYMIMRVFRGCSRNVKEMAYKSIVRPQLEYASSAWDPSQDYLIRELEGVQRKAARFVMGDFRQHSSVTRMMALLGREELKSRRQQTRLGNMFRTM